MNNIIEANEQSFEQEVTQAGVPMLVDFYAPWCGPCKMLAPVLDKLAQEFAGRAKVVKVNVDDAPGLAAEFGITGVPTMMFFKGSLLVDRVVGFAAPKDLKARLENLSTPAPAATVAA